MSGLRL